MQQAKVSMDIWNPRATTAVIAIHGDMTAAAEGELMAAYNKATEEGAKSIILNFNDLDYMNSSGIGLLVTLLIRINRNKQRLCAFGLSDHYRTIFELTKLDDAIHIFPTEEEAVQGARR